MNKITFDKKTRTHKWFKISTIKVVVVLLILSALTLEGVNIFFSNRMATDSIVASKLKRELAVIVQENEILQAKVYELSSYESVASRAAEFGFKEPVSTISLNTPVQVARQ